MIAAGIYNAFNFSGPIILGKIVTFLQTSDNYQRAQEVETLVSHFFLLQHPPLLSI